MFRHNKRGQEGLTWQTLLGGAVGIVVVVLVILFATGVFNFGNSKLNIAPGQDLQSIASSCEIAAKADLKADFCFEFKRLKSDSGKVEYVNCLDDRIINSMKELPTQPECGDLTSVTRAKISSLLIAGEKDPVVNGVSSDTLAQPLVCESDLNGISDSKDCTTAQMNGVNYTKKIVLGSGVCCVKA